MQPLIAGIIAVAGPIGAVFAFSTMLCAYADMMFPIPKPGSKWVKTRSIISAIGANRLNAENRILPGSLEAVATVSQVLQTVLVTHAEAERGRAAIVATLATKVLQ